MADEGAAGSKIEELARFLKEKKSRGQSVGLVLGHRTGTLYNNDLYRVIVEGTNSFENIYTVIKNDKITLADVKRWSEFMKSFDRSSAIDQFSASYSFLGEHCNELNIYAILQKLIMSSYPNSSVHVGTQQSMTRQADDVLAKLIRIGFFEPIITTNIDALLEDGCNRCGMREKSDYGVFMVRKSMKERIGLDSRKKIIKVFGDFISKNYYTAGQELDLDLEEHKDIKSFLVSELSKDIIVVGYDPLWDWPIERAFREEGGSIWYVDEELPIKNSHLEYVLNRRNTSYIDKIPGRYNYFVQVLTEHLDISSSLQAEGTMLPLEATALDPKRKKAFVSYSRKNKNYLEDLLKHIKGYMHVEGENNVLDTRIDIWDDMWNDTQIAAGQDWWQEITNALAEARVAILLISADFLASDFIREHELPPLLEAAQKKELLLLPILLAPSAFPQTKLGRYQAMNEKPIMGMSPAESEAAWAKITRDIYTIMHDET
jgi:TIR domain